MAVSTVKFAPMLAQNLLSTVSLAKKIVEIFLREKSGLSIKLFEEEIFGFVNIVDSQ